ncbi:hypothetical protein V866_002604 [Kwoniella sp. B9012]|uniref:Uncharacterized protein n=1 Tax=Kwoniella europaea PYCC6329 TaxID=1423913 RepID=A0AAX4KEN3_9TREE
MSGFPRAFTATLSSRRTISDTSEDDSASSNASVGCWPVKLPTQDRSLLYVDDFQDAAEDSNVSSTKSYASHPSILTYMPPSATSSVSEPTSPSRRNSRTNLPSIQLTNPDDKSKRIFQWRPGATDREIESIDRIIGCLSSLNLNEKSERAKVTWLEGIKRGCDLDVEGTEKRPSEANTFFGRCRTSRKRKVDRLTDSEMDKLSMQCGLNGHIRVLKGYLQRLDDA